MRMSLLNAITREYRELVLFSLVNYKHTHEPVDRPVCQTEDLKEAWQILHALIDPSGDRQLVRLRMKTDITHAIVTHLDGNYNDLGCIFLALNLRNISYVDVTNEESVALFLEQHKVNSQLQELLIERASIKPQLKDIAEKLKQIREKRKLDQAQVNSSKSSSPSGRPQGPQLPNQPAQPYKGFTPL